MSVHDKYAHFMTTLPKNKGRCMYFGIIGREDGKCLGSDPKNAPGPSHDELKNLEKAFHDPTMLFSTGVNVKDTKFTFLKIENGSSILARTRDLGCIVVKADEAFILAIFSGEELFKPIYENCMKIATALGQPVV